MLHHAPGDELVVFGVAETAGDGFEGLDEFREVCEAVDGFGVVERERVRVVASAELDQSCRRDGALKVKVELRLGQAANEVPDRGHNSSLARRQVGKSAALLAW